MTGIQLQELPNPARAAWISLRDELRTLLADDLVAIWAYGGSTSVNDAVVHVGDLDTHVLVSQRPDRVMVKRIEEAEDRVARECGVEWDIWFVHADDAHGADPPRHVWRKDRRDTSWALHRAHWLAGRYVGLHGAQPKTIVKPPSWEELENELSRELEHIERHILEGDTDPYEATYAILNGCRILHSVETRNVAISKRAAGAWGLEHLPARWHAAVRAALRAYDGQPTAETVALQADEMAPFIAFVRQRLPYPEDREADSMPRWSGY